MKTVRIDKKSIDNQPDLFPTSSKKFFAPESEEPPIKTTIGETPREFSNVEAEAGESVLTTDSQFFRINGKKHSQGGTPLALSEGDFIFSDKLKIKGKEVKDLYQWVNEDKKYSYSDLSKRYGKKLNYFRDKADKSDDQFDKDTADLMQANILEKLGEISILQEGGKGFPQGLPAPAQNFYGQVGGPVPYTTGKTLSPTGRNTNYDRKIDYDIARLKAAGFDTSGGAQAIQSELYERLITQDPAELAYMWSNFGDTAKGGTGRSFRNVFGDPKQFTSKEEFKQAAIERFGTIENLAVEVAKWKGSFTDNKWGARTGYLTDLVTREPQGSMPRRSIPGIGGIPAHAYPDNISVTPRTIQSGQPNTFSPTSNSNSIPGIQDPNTAAPNVTSNEQLRLSLPDSIALANSLYNLSSVPKQYPTRYENYGIPQAMGILQNVKPLDYQSQINEVNKAVGQAAAAVNTYSRSPQEQASIIASIYGQSLESASKIRGNEYNANAQLYNNNSAQLAQFAVSRGADLAANAEAYNTKVDALNQNFYEDKTRARNSVVQTGIQGYMNAVGINAQNQLNPNYKIDPYRLTIGFKAPGYNPLTSGIPQGNFFSPVSALNNNFDALKAQYPDVPEKSLLGIARSVTRWKPVDYQDDLYGKF